MHAVMKTASKLYKSYLFTVVVKEAKKLADKDFKKMARKAMKNVDFDKRYWLHKVGLTPYTPVKSGISGGLLLLAGAAVGALGALALSPMRGEDFRHTVKQKAQGFMHKDELGQTQAPAQA